MAEKPKEQQAAESRAGLVMLVLILAAICYWFMAPSAPTPADAKTQARDVVAPVEEQPASNEEPAPPFMLTPEKVALPKDIPGYIETAWRSRLAGLAPECGLRSAEWAAALEEGQSQLSGTEAPQQDVLFTHIPEEVPHYQIRGAIAAYVMIGKYVAAWGHPTCGEFGPSLALDTADTIVQKVTGSDTHYSEWYLPDQFNKSIMAIFAGDLAQHCRVRTNAWGEAAFSANHKAALDQLFDGQTSRDKMPETLIEVQGAVLAAEYAADRVASIYPQSCRVIRHWEPLADADKTRAAYLAHPEWFTRHLQTPDD